MESEENTYQAPNSELTSGSEVELASRGKRLAAALIDGLIAMVCGVLFWVIMGKWDAMLTGAYQPGIGMNLLGAVFGFAIFAAIHGHFLKTRGQTLGKMALNIRIVRLDGTLERFIPLFGKRYVAIGAVTLIPVIGLVVALVDVLMIFRSDRRCLHDLIAGTRVVSAR